jgi:predicted MFS family arabinose efflux permease
MDFERATNRHVMSPLHAGFSGGTLAGAGLVWLIFAAGGGFRAVYLGLAAIMTLAMFWAIILWRTVSLPHQREALDVSPSLALSLLRRSDIRLFAILTGLSFGGEALISQWAAIYLRDERDFSAGVGVFAIAAYGFSMFVGRITNGPVSATLGKRVAILLQGGVTLVGGILIFMGGPAAVAIIGCGLAGLGLAGTGPLALSLAGAAVPGAAGAASGATLAGGYLGFAAAPILAGVVATTISVRGVMVGIAIAGLLVIVMALRLPTELLKPETVELAPTGRA